MDIHALGSARQTSRAGPTERHGRRAVRLEYLSHESGPRLLLASWEVPSLNLIDQVKKLRERIPDPNFEVLGICVDDGRERLLTLNNWSLAKD